MRVFAHYSGNQRNSAEIEFMSYPVSCYCQNARVAEDYLFGAYRGWVSVVGGFDVSAKTLSYLRNLLQKLFDYHLRSFLAHIVGALADFSANVFEAFLHLIRELSVDRGQGVAKKVFDIGFGDALFSQVTWKEYCKQVFKDFDDH